MLKQPAPAFTYVGSKHAPVHLLLALLPNRLARARADRLVVVPDAGAARDDADQRIRIALVQAAVLLAGDDDAAADHLPDLDRFIDKDGSNARLADVHRAQQPPGLRAAGALAVPNASSAFGTLRDISIAPDRGVIFPRRQPVDADIEQRHRRGYLHHPDQAAHLILDRGAMGFEYANGSTCKPRSTVSHIRVSDSARPAPIGHPVMRHM
jgi:hypothetical protein